MPAPVNPLRSVEAARVGSSLQLTLAFAQDVRACGTAPDVLLGTGSVPHGGWQGYAFRLRCRPEESAACLETLESDGTGTAIAKFPLETREAEIRLSLPLEALDAAGEPAIYLKAASEVENPRDILSYYTSVSYTHLDVYKRQLLQQRQISAPGPCQLSVRGEMTAPARLPAGGGPADAVEQKRNEL